MRYHIAEGVNIMTDNSLKKKFFELNQEMHERQRQTLSCFPDNKELRELINLIYDDFGHSMSDLMSIIEELEEGRN